MIIWALLWAFIAVAEGFGYVHFPTRQSRQRTALIGIILFLLVVSMVLRLWAGWQAWTIFCVIGAYRVLNLGRFWYARLPEARLRSVSIRAHVWLVTMQALVLAIGSIVTHWHLSIQLLNSLVALQLLVALILMRATTHTWRHATAPAEAPALASRELPAVSVLVPARNETGALEECLQLLTASDYPKLEILVLDDCSVTRRTPEIIRAFAHSGVRFLQGQVPDENHWLAKNYAYDQLAKEANGELLLFCGVDTLLSPQSIRRLVTALEERKKNMLSVMPLRRQSVHEGNSLYQAMRYYWELCLPRRFFKRPPVLSTCWLIRRETLDKMGGFESDSHSVSPEASFARQAVTTDSYSFIRGDDLLGVYSNKPASEQYGTSVRVRYPQLHRRLELVALTSLLELTFLLGPLIGLLMGFSLRHGMAYMAVWSVTLLCLLVTYGFTAVGARLTNPWYGWLFMPVAFVLDIVVVHISLWQYEFGAVEWKGRNICLPVMQLQPPKK